MTTYVKCKECGSLEHPDAIHTCNRQNANAAVDKMQPPVAPPVAADIVTRVCEAADVQDYDFVASVIYAYRKMSHPPAAASCDECEQRALAAVADADTNALGEYLREIGFQPLAAASPEPGAVVTWTIALRDALYAAHVAGQRVHDLRVDTVAAMAYANSGISAAPRADATAEHGANHTPE